MKKSGILNAELMRVIASMGHTDLLVIADSGLPIPASVPRIDLALVAGVPSFLQVLQAVLAELQVEAATVAEEMRQRSPALYQAARHLLGATPLQHIAHEELRHCCRGCGVSCVPASRPPTRTSSCTVE